MSQPSQTVLAQSVIFVFDLLLLLLLFMFSFLFFFSNYMTEFIIMLTYNKYLVPNLSNFYYLNNYCLGFRASDGQIRKAGADFVAK